MTLLFMCRDQALNSVELRIVREALRLSSAALSVSPKLLPQQLIGRLLPFVSGASVHRYVSMSCVV